MPAATSSLPGPHDKAAYVYRQDDGPEVVRNDFPELAGDDGLQVVESHNEKEVFTVEKGSIANPTARSTIIGRLTNRKGVSKRCLLLSALVILAILITAILGGVLGSNAARARDTSPASSSSPATTSPSATTPSAPESPATTSSTVAVPLDTSSVLASASWHNMDNEEDQSFVAYQRPDGSFQVSRYVKPFISDDGFWAPPHSIRPENTPKSQSGLAIGQLFMNQSSYLDMTFISRSNTLDGALFDTSAQWNDLELRQERELRKEVPGNSRLAAFGIMMVFQENDGTLTLRRRYGNDARWNTEMVSENITDAMSGTNLAIVPLSANYTEVYNERALGVFYQNQSGRLVARAHGERGSPANSWPSNFPEIELAPGGPFAAFSVRRASDFRNDLVNTFILYESTSSAMTMLWTDDGEVWRSSTPEGLAGANPGTSIACTSPDTLDEEDYWTLGAASAMTRCYFFEDHSLVKVQLSGREWVNKERVRIV
ncbi:hypothetical protein B0I35DRAFT_434413 [Stachybotrys elegans]|uniref:Fucose-specific lectin n=1 Tax=Stachybotrys elegans TaxID=80388 RepID=A0A8K0SVB9_9HYPO|nr:hypothetical protein B0I35DRAFT_434413 [Stachybotrys elegans]